jgi:hypothetical protein
MIRSFCYITLISFFGANWRRSVCCYLPDMRPLTQDESKAVFEKLANYIVRGSQLREVAQPLLFGCTREKILCI